jgi:adenosylcobinamide-GDP ribazoletransferase
MGKLMKNFLIGLQFLTRIHAVKQVDWQPGSFGQSVKYFPLVGAVLGAILSVVSYSLDSYLPLVSSYLPLNVSAVFLVMLDIFLTGGLHCDGLMDTADGLFSGRQQERMLEIMKDSRVGSNGVIAFCCLFFLKWSLLIDISTTVWPVVLFIAPILGRFAMVIGITAYPYARPEGIGK